MSWVLRAKVETPVDGDDENREFIYEDEDNARRGYEAMLRNGYLDISLVEE